MEAVIGGCEGGRMWVGVETSHVAVIFYSYLLTYVSTIILSM